MKSTRVLAGCLLGAAISLGGTAFGNEEDKVQMAGAAKVTIDQAIKMASEKVLGTVIEAELEEKHDKTVWEVEIVTGDQQVMEVHIDAVSGSIIDVEPKAEKRREKKRERKREHKD